MAQDLTREEFVRGAVAVVGATVASSVVLADDAHLPKSRRKSALRAQMERRRTIHASDTPRAIKQKLGQYFTPGNIADFMASLFPKATDANVRILDPGAGIGILSCALMERMEAEKWAVGNVAVDAYEIDDTLLEQLRSNLADAMEAYGGETTIYNEDFLSHVAMMVKNGEPPPYTHVIMNPPYRKIRTNSDEREFARAIGLETVNLYTAFMGAAIAVTAVGGRIVAIVPRSFCNGPYYKPFRDFMLERCAIEHIHLFDSRNSAFKDEAVLQENVIVMLERGGKQGDVTISLSPDGTLKDVKSRSVPFEEIVKPEDPERYINIPSANASKVSDAFAAFRSNLNELGFQVSTGAVVDFRMKGALCNDHVEGTVPLLYSVHFRNCRVHWPVVSKKPNAIRRSAETERLLLPRGYYVAVKRFSAKEERRRLVAALVSPADFKDDALAFENHLNIFMQHKHGLSRHVAHGLVAWLNTTWLDERFRIFSGHTQVNATDLRNLPYPSIAQLEEIGRKLGAHAEWSQDVFDSISMEVANGK